jgi:Icc-related predicted phosphoesterase
MPEFIRKISAISFLFIASFLPAQQSPASLNAHLKGPLRFIAYGDTRFTDPTDTKAASADVRQALVHAIADVHPDFITFSGDIAYNGDKAEDWQVYDKETAIWREKKIPVYPALGNHEIRGDINLSLANYFQRFPDLKQSRFYSMRAANTLTLALDSNIDELTGPQGDWLKEQFKKLPVDVDFIFIMLHHPPNTSATDDKTKGGGHSVRPSEQALAEYLEQLQAKLRARIVVFAGHVHNYDRHEHGGVTYFVSGGGGAHAYVIHRELSDPFQGDNVNFHYILVEVKGRTLKTTMNRVEIVDGKEKWSQPDSCTVTVPEKAKPSAKSNSKY